MNKEADFKDLIGDLSMDNPYVKSGLIGSGLGLLGTFLLRDRRTTLKDYIKNILLGAAGGVAVNYAKNKLSTKKPEEQSPAEEPFGGVAKTDKQTPANNEPTPENKTEEAPSNNYTQQAWDDVVTLLEGPTSPRRNKAFIGTDESSRAQRRAIAARKQKADLFDKFTQRYQLDPKSLMSAINEYAKSQGKTVGALSFEPTDKRKDEILIFHWADKNGKTDPNIGKSVTFKDLMPFIKEPEIKTPTIMDLRPTYGNSEAVPAGKSSAQLQKKSSSVKKAAYLAAPQIEYGTDPNKWLTYTGGTTVFAPWAIPLARYLTKLKYRDNLLGEGQKPPIKLAPTTPLERVKDTLGHFKYRTLNNGYDYTWSTPKHMFTTSGVPHSDTLGKEFTNLEKKFPEKWKTYNGSRVPIINGRRVDPTMDFFPAITAEERPVVENYAQHILGKDRSTIEGIAQKHTTPGRGEVNQRTGETTFTTPAGHKLEHPGLDFSNFKKELLGDSHIGSYSKNRTKFNLLPPKEKSFKFKGKHAALLSLLGAGLWSAGHFGPKYFGERIGTNSYND